MNGEIRACGYGAHPVVDGLGQGCGGNRVDDDVGVRKHALDGFGGCGGDLFGALERHVARHRERQVGEIA